ncbi:MAG: hypothetical protein HWE20_06690 [Gammaproteobacteria bacterium]|nr:hypothetical protein [Gammaproteobacteria bacterium]
MTLSNIILWAVLSLSVALIIYLSLPMSPNRRAVRRHKAFYAGLKHLLVDQPDHALDAFINQIRIDQDSAELHITVGSLFRKKGEIDRAIKIHSQIVKQSALSQQWRATAQLELANDYLAAGWYDRGESVLNSLPEGEIPEEVVMRTLLDALEIQREWRKALQYTVQRPLQDRNIQLRGVHYCCELAVETGELKWLDSVSELKLVDSLRPAIERFVQSDEAQRLAMLDKMMDMLSLDPNKLNFCFQALADSVIKSNNTSKIQHFSDWLLTYKLPYEQVKQFASQAEPHLIVGWLATYVVRHPSLTALNDYLERLPVQEEVVTALAPLVTKMATQRKRYRCTDCGFKADQIYWQCPGCRAWETMLFVPGIEGH